MSDSGPTYRLDFASAVWRQLGTLEKGEYLRVVNTLRSMAQRAPPPTGSARAGVPRSNTLQIDELTVDYEIDHLSNTVRVLDVQRREPSSSA